MMCLGKLVSRLLEAQAFDLTVSGRTARVDYECQRQGMANLFPCFEPLAGRRHVA